MLEQEAAVVSPDQQAPATPAVTPRHHVFLSHNSKEKAAVTRLAERLKRAEIEPWLDAWALTPGRAWQEELAAGVHSSTAFAFFVGPNGYGDWAREELQLAHDRAAKDPDFRLFPVLLPGLPEPFDASTLPPFLRMRTWVDLRGGIDGTRGFQDLICAITGVPFGPSVPIEPRNDVCPYRGLLGFDEEHAEFYFGRDGEVQRLLEKLKVSRFLAVLGPSGSGKSSVVRAGLVPALRRGALPGTESWTIRIFKPGSRPLVELAAQVADIYPRQDMAGLIDRMLADERGLDLAVALGQVGRPESERVVWVVDQFEETFTLCPDGQERAMFLANLLYAASVPGGRSAVVLTMRADFYHRCAAHPELASPIAAQQFLVSPMDREELRQAIEEPARRVGLEFEAGLVGTILEDVERQPGALPLLEYALLELWHRRRGGLLTLEGYRESGGVQGAIAQRADEHFDSFGAEEQAIARRIMLRLTQPGEGTEDTRRRARLDELITHDEEREPVEAIIRVLTDARLLTTSGDDHGDKRWVDISHEALIRSWPRLRRWLDDGRAALRVHRRLTEAAQEWLEEGRDDDLLYRGTRLEEAREWRRGHDPELNDLEREFLAASVAFQERERARLAQERAARDRLRRRITVTAVAVAIFGVLLAGFAGFQRKQAEEQRQIAEQRRQVSLSRQLAAQVLTLLDNQLDLALLLSLEANRVADTVEARRGLLQSVLANPRLARFLHGHSDVQGLAFSSDGRTLASAGSDGAVRLWDAADGRAADPPIIVDAGPVTTLAFAPDGRTLATAGVDGAVRFWDVASGRAAGPPLAVDGGPVTTLALGPDGRTLAAGGADGAVRLWDAADGRAVGQLLAGHDGPVMTLAFGPDGRTLASGGVDRMVRLWDTTAGQAVGQPLDGHSRPVSSLAFGPDGRTLASGGADGAVRLWDAAGQAVGQPLTGHSGPVMTLAFAPDGRTLASGSIDRTVKLWDTTSGRAVGQPLASHTERLNGIAFSPDGRMLASGGGDGTIRIWDVAGDRALSRSLVDGGGPVQSVAISPNGAMLAVGGDDGGIRRWDAAAGRPIGPPLGAEGAPVWRVAYSPDGQTLASGGLDGSIQLWDATSGQPRGRPLTGHTHRVTELAFSPDGRVLASVSQDGSTRLWDVATGQPQGQPIAGRAASVHGLAFSPDGRMIAVGSLSTVQLWDVATGQAAGPPLAGHSADVESVAFSPDGRMLASGGLDRTVQLWDVASASALGPPLMGHDDDIESVAFSPDGRMVASAGLDRTIRLWDVATGQAIGPPLAGHTDSVHSLAFAPDGRTLISGSSDGSVRIWDVSIESWRTRACERANRNQLPDEWDRYLGDEPYQKTCPDLPGPDGGGGAAG